MTLRRTAPFALLLGVLLAVSLLLPGAALAKEYAIDSVDIQAGVSPDGSLSVQEARQLTFDGDFSRVYWILDKGGSSGITVTGVTDDRGTTYTPMNDTSAIDDPTHRVPGTYLVVDTGDTVEVHVFHSSSNETRTFTLSYVAAGAAKRWQDTGELYWKLIGEGWAVPTAKFSALVRVDGVTSKDQMRAWAHGPLTGVVTINDDGSVALKANDVPAETFVEVRMAFPSEALSQAPFQSGARLNTILTEEKAAADTANSQRLRARFAVGAWTGVSWIVALGALAWGIWAFNRHGREHKTEFQGEYFREDPRPDLHPAVVGALWKFGTVDDVAIAATLMDLADKGIVRMAPQTVQKSGISGMFGGTEESFSLERVKNPPKPPSPLDVELLGILFDEVGGGRDVIALSEIQPYAKANPQSFTEAIKAWKEKARAEADSLGFFEGESWMWQVMAGLAAALVIGVAIFGTVATAGPFPLLLPIPVAIALAVIAVYMRRRSRQGNELYAQYEAVRNYLKDFSRLNEAPPQSVILWNRFLVLAVLFGIAEEVIEQLRVRMPELVSDPSFQTSYWWVYAGGYGHASPVAAVSQSFVSATQVATSQMSSASGGGGGFSGGGGFGGGGGGGGAD